MKIVEDTRSSRISSRIESSFIIWLMINDFRYLGTLGLRYLCPSPLAASLSLSESGVPALRDDLDARPAAPVDIGTERAVRSLTYTYIYCYKILLNYIISKQFH